jgi:hypothetical protein
VIVIPSPRQNLCGTDDLYERDGDDRARLGEAALAELDLLKVEATSALYCIKRPAP